MDAALECFSRAPSALNTRSHRLQTGRKLRRTYVPFLACCCTATSQAIKQLSPIQPQLSLHIHIGTPRHRQRSFRNGRKYGRRRHRRAASVGRTRQDYYGYVKLDIIINAKPKPKSKSLTFRGPPRQPVHITICYMVSRFLAYALRCFRRWA